MNHEELKLRLGANITRYRKARAMTQAELAQRLNYSDKAVSKWERGESVPDVLTLTQIAQEFGVTVNELIYGDELPPAPEPEPEEESREPVRSGKPLHTKSIVQKLVTILVWFVALFIYILVDGFGLPYGWLAFVVAVPVNAIVLLSLRSAWGLFGWNMALVSIIVWGVAALIYMVIYVSSGIRMWRIFLMGALGQAAVVLWFKMLKNNEEARNG